MSTLRFVLQGAINKPALVVTYNTDIGAFGVDSAILDLCSLTFTTRCLFLSYAAVCHPVVFLTSQFLFGWWLCVCVCVCVCWGEGPPVPFIVLARADRCPRSDVMATAPLTGPAPFGPDNGIDLQDHRLKRHPAAEQRHRGPLHGRRCHHARHRVRAHHPQQCLHPPAPELGARHRWRDPQGAHGHAWALSPHTRARTPAHPWEHTRSNTPTHPAPLFCHNHCDR